MRHFFEMNDYVRQLFCKPFSRCQMERNVLPSPVVDEHRHHAESRGERIRPNSRFLPITRNLLPIHRAPAVLSQDKVLAWIITRNRPKSPKYLDMLVSDLVRLEKRRWLHRDDCK